MSWCEPHPRRIATAAEVEENRRKIRELDQQIEALENSHDGIQKGVELLRERANLQSFIAPFHLLPAEILCEIASYCINDGMKPTNLNQINAAMRAALKFSDPFGGFEKVLTQIMDGIHSSVKGSLSFDLYLSSEGSFSALRHPALLKSNQLYLESETDTVIATIPLGTMPSLQSLTIINIPCSLSKASLPNLLDLVVTAAGDEFQIDIDDIPEQIRRVELNWLTLGQYRQASTLPRIFPNLEEVTLSDVSISALALGCLLAPRLRKLILEDQLAEYDRDISSELDILCTQLISALQPEQFRSLPLWDNARISYSIIGPIDTSTFHLPHLKRVTIRGRGIEQNTDILAEFQRQCTINRPWLEVLID